MQLPNFEQLTEHDLQQRLKYKIDDPKLVDIRSIENMFQKVPESGLDYLLELVSKRAGERIEDIKKLQIEMDQHKVEREKLGMIMKDLVEAGAKRMKSK